VIKPHVVREVFWSDRTNYSFQFSLWNNWTIHDDIDPHAMYNKACLKRIFTQGRRNVLRPSDEGNANGVNNQGGKAYPARGWPWCLTGEVGNDSENLAV
jgi:hypothetical protein